MTMQIKNGLCLLWLFVLLLLFAACSHRQKDDELWHKDIDEWFQLIIVHSFHLLGEMNMTETRDYPTMLLTLKGLYLSTRSNDKDLTTIRKLGEKIIKGANGKINNSLALATRTACILYITLRAIVTIAR